MQNNENGKEIRFTKKGLKNVMHFNPNFGKHVPDLKKDLKRAIKICDIENKEKERKKFVSHYEIYRGLLGDHWIEVSLDGTRRYFLSKNITPEQREEVENIIYKNSFKYKIMKFLFKKK